MNQNSELKPMNVLGLVLLFSIFSCNSANKANSKKYERSSRSSSASTETEGAGTERPENPPISTDTTGTTGTTGDTVATTTGSDPEESLDQLNLNDVEVKFSMRHCKKIIASMNGQKIAEAFYGGGCSGEVRMIKNAFTANSPAGVIKQISGCNFGTASDSRGSSTSLAMVFYAAPPFIIPANEDEMKKNMDWNMGRDYTTSIRGISGAIRLNSRTPGVAIPVSNSCANELENTWKPGGS